MVKEESIFGDWCPICYEQEIVTGDDPLDEVTFEFECHHRFCVPCSCAMLRDAIKDNNLEMIVCPEATCRQKVSDSDLSRLFASEPEIIKTLAKLRDLQLDKDNELLRYCVKPNCEGKILAPNAKVSVVQCSRCRTKVCFRCREKWHRGTCEDNRRKVYRRYFDDTKNYRTCPMCVTPIERTGGCNHMTCTFCKFEFCWICGDPATEKSEHWGPYSLTGCGAEWLDRKVDKRDLDKLRQKQISNLVCLFFCFPIIVLFTVPYLLTIGFLEQTDSMHSNWSNWLRVPVAILTFILGIPLGVIAIPFALVAIIYKLVHDCCYVRCCKKTPNQLAAEEVLR